MNLFVRNIWSIATTVDTTSAAWQSQYKLGQNIGEYLPAAVILIIAFYIIRKKYRHK